MFKALSEYGVGERVTDTAMIQDIKVVPCKDGSTAWFCTCVAKEVSFTGKLWKVDSDMSVVNTLKGKVVQLVGTINVWDNKRELKIAEMRLVDEDSKNYMESVDYGALSEEFTQLLRQNLSEPYMNVARLLLQAIDYKAFITRAAALGFHDAVIGGLIHHTVKCMKIFLCFTVLYPEMEPFKEVTLLGIALHDIGKIWEYTEEKQMSELWFVDHKAYGIECLALHKDAIVEQIGISNYYHLMALINEHHGEFGEPCHSVPACLAHYVDFAESRVTHLMQEFTKAKATGVTDMYIDEAHVSTNIPAPV